MGKKSIIIQNPVVWRATVDAVLVAFLGVCMHVETGVCMHVEELVPPGDLCCAHCYLYPLHPKWRFSAFLHCCNIA